MGSRHVNSPYDQVHATAADGTVQAAPDNGTGDSMTQESGNGAFKLAEDTRDSKPPARDPKSLIYPAREVSRPEQEEERPPLPPRPSSLLQTPDRPGTAKSTRPALQAKPTTALTSIDIQTLSFPDGTRGTFSTPASRTVSESFAGTPGGQSTPSRKVSRNGSEADDSASVMSYVPTLKANRDLASLLDEGLNAQSLAWKLLNSQADTANPFERIEYEDGSLMNFEHEFDDIEAVDSKEGGNEGKFSLPHPPTGHSLQILTFSRGSPAAMEIQAQTLPNLIFCWQTNLQPPRRPKFD